jgi:phosphoribosylformylglycinamidine synthase
MLHFFFSQPETVYALQSEGKLNATDISKLEWLFGEARLKQETSLSGFFVGPRAAMITPWSTMMLFLIQW